MSHLGLVKLTALMERTSGKPEIVVGLLDGPVAINHPDLATEHIREIPGNIRSACAQTKSIACMHGTFVAGILCAKRNSNAPAICPNCTLLVRPIFAEAQVGSLQLPSATPEELAAAGNQGAVGSSAITRHPWVIPVVAYDLRGRPINQSNLGGSIGRRGLGAPGDDVTSLGADGGPITFGGTSVAVPFVTGAIALLWSQFPTATAAEVKFALTQVSTQRRTTVVPPLLDAWAAYQVMVTTHERS